jgi:hypothetical protein
MTDYIFPLDASKISWTTKMKPKWDVTSYRSVGQMRKALVQQNYPLWTFDIEFPVLDKRDVDTLLAFHALCKGSWHPFFYKDYERYAVLGKALQQDANNKYQAVIPFGEYEEPARKIDHVVMWVDGVRSKLFTVDGGLITVTASGTDIKFDYEYYYKVIFADSITVSQKFYDMYKVSLQLEVVQ